jgi:formyltetrahydrofolate synthetase
MTANQFKKAVGRAWNKNNLKGPKLINTVVGIHNDDWKNLFENLMDKQNKIENDLESIEKKILKIKLLKLKKKSLALKINE